MSERAAAAGKDGSPHEIQHNGKTYVIQPVLTERVIFAVEERLYEREKRALASLKDVMDKDAYERKLDDLLQRYLDGDFSFESENAMEFLQKRVGAVLLLECMMGVPKAEIIELLAAKPNEVQRALKHVLELSLPAQEPVVVEPSPEDRAAEAPKGGDRLRGRRQRGTPS